MPADGFLHFLVVKNAVAVIKFHESEELIRGRLFRFRSEDHVLFPYDLTRAELILVRQLGICYSIHPAARNNLSSIIHLRKTPGTLLVLLSDDKMLVSVL